MGRQKLADQQWPMSFFLPFILGGMLLCCICSVLLQHFQKEPLNMRETGVRPSGSGAALGSSWTAPGQVHVARWQRNEQSYGGARNAGAEVCFYVICCLSSLI